MGRIPGDRSVRGRTPGRRGHAELLAGVDADVRPAIDGLKPDDDIVALTWLHLADRTVLRVHPRGDTSRPMRGVFATRSQHRPMRLSGYDFIRKS